MKDPKISPKEAAGATQVKGAAGTSESVKLEYCHGSVCLGNQKPTNCICPTVKK